MSTNEQAGEGVSLEAQRAKLEAYATFKGLELVDVVVDAGVSAKRPLSSRAGGARVLAMVEHGEAAAVVAVKLDRLFRNAADCLTTTAAWDARGVALHLLDMGMDTSTALGRAFLTMAAAFAELERNLVSERTRDALAHVQAEGATLGGEAYGFTRADELDEHGRRLVVEVQSEAEVVRRILELRDGGATYREVCAALEAEGAPTKRGGRWFPGTVRGIERRAREASR